MRAACDAREKQIITWSGIAESDDDVPGRSDGGRAGIERDRRGVGLAEAPVVQGHRPAWAAERVAAVRRETVAGTAANARAIL